MAKANMFQKAKQTDAKPKPKGKQKVRVEVSGLHTYAAIQQAKKVLETMEETLKAEINSQSLEYFVENRTSESFEGHEDHTTASCQLRKRSSRSALSDQELAVLEELDISTEKSADSKFFINSKYAEDQELLEKVSEALEGIVPDDFIGHTGEKYVTTKTSLTEAFHKVSADKLRDVLPIVGTLAARTSFGGNHEEMVQILDGVLKDDEEDLEENLKASLKS